MAARTGRLHWLDWVLVGTLVPLYFVLLALQVREGIETGAGFVWVRVASAAGAHDFPTVYEVVPGARIEGRGLLAGDRLVQLGDRSFAGASVRDCMVPLTIAARRPEGARVEVARGGEHFAITLFATPRPLWWSSIPSTLGWVVTSAILLLRAPRWALRRRYFIGALGVSLYFAADEGLLAVALPGAWYIALAAWPIGVGAALSTYWSFGGPATRQPAWVRVHPWLMAAALFGCAAAGTLLPVPAASLGFTTWLVLSVIAFLSGLVGLTLAYVRSDALGQRQVRWVLYGLYVSLVPSAVTMGAYVLGVLDESFLFAILVSQLFSVAAPLGMLVAVLGYRFLDIDRLISATTSYTILGVILLGVALQVIPRVAAAAGPAVGLSPAAGQWLLSIAIAAAAVQGHRWLRPWLDRRLFAERVAVEEGLAQVTREIGGCTTAQELTRMSGERIDALLRPESIAVYAREGEAFTPVFARAAAAPPAFAADSPLVKTLESRAAPLAATSDALDAFDRAALATLGAEVVVPTRRGAALAAFTCLGRKRSGDIYTPAELALLSAVAGASATVLQHLGDAEVLDQARAMQASLRRYVPGAIAEQIESGRELSAGEREVTVLFVDLRGYTGYAENRPPGDVFSTVNEHTERVSRIVRARGGAVVEFNGDGMMAVFGAPEALIEKERKAIEAAREIVDTSPGDFAVGIGIATGPAYAGNIRAADRWIWSVIGDTTNLAARLQVLTRELDASIAVDEPTRRAAGYVCIDFARHEDVPLRGRGARVDVFALPLRPMASA